jgi:hypothetical protein
MQNTTENTKKSGSPQKPHRSFLKYLTQSIEAVSKLTSLAKGIKSLLKAISEIF